MNVEPSSNTVAWCGDHTNIYGCTPCPWCGRPYRAAYKRSGEIECDDCGFTVPADFEEGLS
jgi:hypothetical protein